MRKRLRYDMPLRLLLQSVVADGGGGIQRFLHVAGLQQLILLAGVVAPDARQAVGLQLLPNGGLVTATLTECASHILNVVSDLVRDHVCFGEIARGAKAVTQIAEEAQIQINSAVARTV